MQNIGLFAPRRLFALDCYFGTETIQDSKKMYVYCDYLLSIVDDQELYHRGEVIKIGRIQHYRN